MSLQQHPLRRDVEFGCISWPVGVEMVRDTIDPPRVDDAVVHCGSEPPTIDWTPEKHRMRQAAKEFLESAQPPLSVIAERGKVYGDPTENHAGIASMWAPMLKPWAAQIAKGEPLPPHVVMLLMSLVKINRMRLVYHEDNYVDAANYLQFAKESQEKHVAQFGGPRPANFVMDAKDYE